MKLLVSTVKLFAGSLIFSFGLYLAWSEILLERASRSSAEPNQPQNAASHSSNNGVDRSVLDQYPNFVPVRPIIRPYKILMPIQYQVSGLSSFLANCEGVSQTGTLNSNAEVEPSVSVNPTNPANLIGAWQQDRWSNGGSRGIGTGVSFDSGRTWNRILVPFSRCGGGNASNQGNYERATDPWLSFSPNGTAHQMALGFNKTSGSQNAMLASRSLDGGLTWSNPVTLILDVDGVAFFNDKNAITADPTDSNFVYAVWDRLASNGNGPTYFARSINGGVTWETAKIIYNPGGTGQTIGNVIVVLPDGSLVDLLTKIVTVAGVDQASLAVIRSSDKGLTWSQPFLISDLLSVGTTDPETGTGVRDGSILGEIAVSPGGTLSVVWQDSRFSGGLHDSIAYSQSQNGGLTWSTPTRINPNVDIPAMLPTVHVRPDGVIGVSYYDFRSNTSDPNTLLTDYWLTTSNDAISWDENRISEAFNLAIAPVAGGYFMGDYQGLVSSDNVFIPFFVKTNNGDLINRTDVYAAPAIYKSVRQSFVMTSSHKRELSIMAKRVHDNIRRVKMQRRNGELISKKAGPQTRARLQ